MLDEPFLSVVNSDTSLFGHQLTRLQYNVGFWLSPHGKGQLVTEGQKLLEMALAGAEDPKTVLQKSSGIEFN